LLIFTIFLSESFHKHGLFTLDAVDDQQTVDKSNWVIVLMGYRDLSWDAFPYKEYYPHYFGPYWWEVFLVPVWALACLATSWGDGWEVWAPSNRSLL